jgi:hypothetical protein
VVASVSTSEKYEKPELEAGELIGDISKLYSLIQERLGGQLVVHEAPPTATSSPQELEAGYEGHELPNEPKGDP